tara:strand:- start:65 stop:616 length:552 start_codon:yes stop_codon:yes gene_type:complete
MVSNNNYIYTYSFGINLFLHKEIMDKKYNSILIIVFFLIILSLVSAFIIEYGLGHEPCKLCIYQRYPYFISILLLTSIFVLKKNVKIHLIVLSIVSLLGAIIAFYHFGIEQGFFDESVVCETKKLNQILSKEDLLKQLKQNTISCKKVTFRLLGLSLASINTIFSLVLSYIFFLIFKKYENDK